MQTIFATFLEEGSVRATQKKITEIGILNKKFINKHGIEKGGKSFSVDTLQSLLTNKVYVGIKEVRHKDGKTEAIKAVWPAIIDESTFTQTQDRLAKNKNRFKPDDWKTYPFPLTELVQCGECGKSLGGKSGTGRSSEKHHYYGHAQIKNPFTKEQVKTCQVKNVRALRIEEIVTRSLRSLLNDPSLISKWIKIYQSKTTSDLPEVQAQSKKLELDIQTTSKRIANLVQRVAEIPVDVPADAFYEQIQQMTQKLNELKRAKENIKTKEMDLKAQEIDQEGLTAKINQVLMNLEAIPKEHHRPVFSNLVKFVEIHPTKIKIVLYAPTKEPTQATGTDGAPSPGNQNSNFTEKEGKLLPFSPNRAGSSTVGNGARGGT